MAADLQNLQFSQFTDDSSCLNFYPLTAYTSDHHEAMVRRIVDRSSHLVYRAAAFGLGASEETF